MEKTSARRSASLRCCRVLLLSRSSAQPSSARPCRSDLCSGDSSLSESSRKSGPSTRGASERILTPVNDLGVSIGEGHQNARYTDAEVEEVRRLYAEGYSLKAVARMMDMPIRTVRGYVDGSRRSQSVSGWRYQKRCRKES